MPYRIQGKCIYKKDGGAKVGCTKGDVHKYMAALHANASESVDDINNEDTKELIKRLIRENFGLFIKDESPDSISFDITSKNIPVGNIVIGRPLRNFGKDALEILSISIKKGETNLIIAEKAIVALFEIYPDINRLVMQPELASKDFWYKLGGQRIDSEYMIIFRGH